MSPLSGWVLGAATVVASPALWSTFVEGSMPMDVALMRFLIAVPISWLLISLVAEMAFPAPGTVKPAPEASPPEPDPAERT
ncbi:MAG: hypothetical protein NTV23_15405 [Propionibacteriales bacterium]|nr:hypothetical protein [Propionibacteriales bacterium]